MKPTDFLVAEHRLIEVVLDCLEALVSRARAGGALDVPRAQETLDLLRSFADRRHHAKEEDRLFPMLVARGMPTHAGPLAVMLDEHRVGRACIARMAEASEAADVERFATAAVEYVNLLNDHIAKEDDVLFPMAEAMIDAASRKTLVEVFEAMESEGRDALRETRARIDALAEHLGVPRGAARPARRSGTACSGLHG